MWWCQQLVVSDLGCARGQHLCTNVTPKILLRPGPLPQVSIRILCHITSSPFWGQYDSVRSTSKYSSNSPLKKVVILSDNEISKICISLIVLCEFEVLLYETKHPHVVLHLFIFIFSCKIPHVQICLTRHVYCCFASTNLKKDKTTIYINIL